MLAQTVADVLKSHQPKAKVFGLSLKDRSAILPTARARRRVLVRRQVRHVHLLRRPRASVGRTFNTSGPADQWFGKEWTRFRTDIDYTAWSGPDAAPGEGKGIEVKEGPAKGWSQKIDFPHPNTGGRDKPGKEYYDVAGRTRLSATTCSLEFAKECITAEHLGEDDIPDLLVDELLIERPDRPHLGPGLARGARRHACEATP